MDTFKEQIIKIKSTPKTLALKALIWLAAVLISAFAILYIAYIGAIIIILEFLLFWGAIKLTGLLNIEYEYIFTNGDLDVDKITAKSSRKRIVSLNCQKIENIGKYNCEMHLPVKPVICCNSDDEAYYIISRDSKGNAVCLVFAPNDKIKEALSSYIPRILRHDAF